MAGDKTYIEDDFGKKHRATRTKAVTPESVVWSSNPNDYTVQVRVSGKWHRAILTYDVQDATFFDNINIDKALVTGGDGKTHTALLVSPEASEVIMSSIPTDEHSLISGTTTGETVVNTYSENWSNVVWQDNVNVYKVLVEGSDGKKHTALLTTSVRGAIEIIVRSTSPLSLPDAIADSLAYLKAFGGTEQRNIPAEYTQVESITFDGSSYVDTGVKANSAYTYKFKVKRTSPYSSNIWGVKTNSSYAADSCIILGWSGVSAVGIYSHEGADSGDNPTAVSWGTDYRTIEFNPTSKKLIIDGVDRWSALENGCLTNENWSSDIYNLYLGGTNTVGAFAGGGVSTWAQYEVWNNGVLIQNLVPCKRNSDNVVGMYDTVSGTFFTNAGTGTFTAGADVTVPTPDTPMDIISNNGVLKARHQSGLPLGYTLLDYIESTGTQYIDTAYTKAQTKDVEAQISITQKTSTFQIFYGLESDIQCALSRDGHWVNYGGVSVTTANLNTWYNTKLDFTNRTLYVDGDAVAVGNEGTNTGGIKIFNNASYKSYIFMKSFKIHGLNGNLICNMVPAKRNSDNVIGMYDIVNGVFYTNAGTGTFTAGNAVSDPVEIYADGTVETINVHGKNLFDVSTLNIGYNFNDSGAENASSYGATSSYIKVTGGTTYTMSFSQNDNSTVYRLIGYDSSQTLLSTPLLAKGTGTPLGTQTYTTTIPSDCVYVRFSVEKSATNVMFEQGSTATAYEPYFNGGTATAEMLLKVGDYEDVQEILSGAVTRNVGVKVLDGTETITASVRPNVFLYDDLPRKVAKELSLCSHYTYTTAGTIDIANNTFGVSETSARIYFKDERCATVPEFQAFLAAQYNAGTPVIIVYPLATPTTESVAGQTLQVQAGDNVVEITQASLNNLELEARYQAAVTLTIQEVQDANLDPNVQVTIN